MAVYSFSQIQTYLQCPLKYKFNYVDKIKPEFEENLHLILGSCVHSSLEYLYKKINNFYIPSLKEITDYFIKEFDQKIFKLKNTDDEKKQFRKRGIVYLEFYYNKNKPFKNIKLIGTEFKIYSDFGDNIKISGIIDRVDKKGTDFIITDYKTNQKLPSQDELLYQEQITLYALGIKQKYGRYLNSIYGNIEYLHFEYNDFWKISEEKMSEIVDKYKKLTFEIETKKAENALGDENAFEPIENNLCRFCDYKEICPLFSHLFGKVTDEDFSEETIKNIIDEYVYISSKKRDIEDQLKKTKDILKCFAQRHKLKRIYGKKHNIKITKQKKLKIQDEQKTKQYLEKINKLQEVLKIDNSSLKKLITNKKVSLEDLKDCANMEDVLYFYPSKNDPEQ